MTRLSSSIGCVLALMVVLPAHAGTSPPFEGCFQAASKLHGVPMDLLLGVAVTESNWDAAAMSHANAHGVMQIQWPGTARHLGVRRVSELYNPCLNISLGAQYLSELLREFGGDETRALAAYNYGPTRIRSERELPQGARAYATRVQQQRQNFGSDVAADPQPTIPLTSFTSQQRAHRVVKHVSEQISAGLEVRAVPNSGWGVFLAAGEKPSVADLSVFRSLGWM